MHAVHLRTTGFYCPACPHVVEKALHDVPGVVHVMAVRSMGLTSIMYDPNVVTPDGLCARIRAAGFGAEIYHRETRPLMNEGEDS